MPGIISQVFRQVSLEDLFQKGIAHGAIDRGLHTVCIHLTVPVQQQIPGCGAGLALRLHVLQHSQISQRGDGGALGVHLSHVFGRWPVQGLQGLGDPLHSEFGRVVNGDVIGIIIAHRPVVGRSDVALRRIDGNGQFIERDIPFPLMLTRPTGHRQPSVDPRPDGYAPPAEIAPVPVDVGEKEIVARVHPVSHAIHQLLAGFSPQHLPEYLRPGGGLFGGGVLEG